jgi:hypothetical protein
MTRRPEDEHADEAYLQAIAEADAYADPRLRAAFINGVVARDMLEYHERAPAGLGIRHATPPDRE